LDLAGKGVVQLIEQRDCVVSFDAAVGCLLLLFLNQQLVAFGPLAWTSPFLGVASRERTLRRLHKFISFYAKEIAQRLRHNCVFDVAHEVEALFELSDKISNVMRKFHLESQPRRNLGHSLKILRQQEHCVLA